MRLPAQYFFFTLLATKKNILIFDSENNELHINTQVVVKE